MHFEGRCAWITGASSGIGEEMARALAARGMKLVLSARRAERLEALASSLPRPDEVLVLPLDVSDDDAVAVAVPRAERAFGGIDLLFLCAGVTQRSHAVDTQLDTVRRIMDINFFGCVDLTQRTLPGMLARGSGHIAVVSSLAGHVGTPRRTAYSASKHALQGYYDSLRAEVHDLGVHVTVLCPGFITTELTSHALTGDGSEYGTRADTAKKNGMSPRDCAAQMVEALDRDANEALIGGKEIAAAYLKRASPGLLARLVRRVKSS